MLAICGLIGTLVFQVTSGALRDPAAYAQQLAEIHRRYDPLTILGVNVGPGLVDVAERAGIFRIFTAPWFSTLLLLLVVSITVCTLDRLPRLWRQVHPIRVVQPEPFFDLRLHHRARFPSDGPTETDVVAALRRKGFRVRTADAPVGQAPARYVYGDRHQFSRMATLLTHLGLVLFLFGGFVTGVFGFEKLVVVAEGETQPLQPVGTEGNLIVKNVSFSAPTRPDGSFADFFTDLVVYRDGVEQARKTVRVNDPLQVGGFVFHQNTFGPAAELEIRDAAGRLAWMGPVILPPNNDLGLPQGFLTVPGSELGLLLVLDRDELGAGLLKIIGLEPSGPNGESTVAFGEAINLGRTTDPTVTGGYSIRWARASAFTGLVVRRDPGEPIIWLAFATLISGLAITFYLPRRRVWVRLEHDGRAQLAMLVDRYVDAEREFGRLLDDLAHRAARRPERRPRSG